MDVLLIVKEAVKLDAREVVYLAVKVAVKQNAIIVAKLDVLHAMDVQQTVQQVVIHHAMNV